MLTSYKDLLVWQKSVDLVIEVYNLTKSFPKEELYGITSQVRRSAVSIPSNIAEGFNRKSKREYVQFIRIAFGSGAELETQLVIIKRLGFASEKDVFEIEQLLEEIMKMLNGLINSLVAKR